MAENNTNAPLIETSAVGFTYQGSDTPALQDVTLSIGAGECVLLGAAQPERCDEILAALGLTTLADRHPMSLSGGQKQRVVVAAAMLSGKDLIVLDEPTSGLDHAHMQQVGQLLQQLKRAGKIVLVITHDEELAADWCDRVIQWNDKEERGR